MHNYIDSLFICVCAEMYSLLLYSQKTLPLGDIVVMRLNRIFVLIKRNVIKISHTLFHVNMTQQDEQI